LLQSVELGDATLDEVWAARREVDPQFQSYDLLLRNCTLYAFAIACELFGETKMACVFPQDTNHIVSCWTGYDYVRTNCKLKCWSSLRLADNLVDAFVASSSYAPAHYVDQILQAALRRNLGASMRRVLWVKESANKDGTGPVLVQFAWASLVCDLRVHHRVAVFLRAIVDCVEPF
jgi:hypothetical protein